MAAGEGKRMNSSIPKVLHLFKGIPILIRIILETNKLNPSKIIIITGKYDEMIKKYIKEYFETEEILNELIFVQQNEPKGTGHAIKCILNSLPDDNCQTLILNGDMPLLSSKLLKKFIADIHPSKLLVSQLDNPYGYGRILYDDYQKFIGIKEEKDCTIEEKKIDVINAGIYLFDSNILKKYIPMIDNNNVQNEYYLTDIVKIIRNDNIDIITYTVPDELKYQIQGVNTQEELKALSSTFF